MASINQSIVHFERLNLNGWRLCCQIRRVLKPMSVVLSHKHILIECIGVALVNAAIHDLSTQLYTTSSASCLTSPPPKGKSFHHFTSSTSPYPTFSSGNNNFLNQIGLGDLENAWGTTFDLNLTHINFICVLQQKKKGGEINRWWSTGFLGYGRLSMAWALESELFQILAKINIYFLISHII